MQDVQTACNRMTAWPNDNLCPNTILDDSVMQQVHDLQQTMLGALERAIPKQLNWGKLSELKQGAEEDPHAFLA